MQASIKFSLVILQAMVLFSAGCSEKAPVAHSIQGNAFPIGAFAASSSDGKWEEIFRDDFTYTILLDQTPIVKKGTYTLHENAIVLEGSFQTCNGAERGTYTYEFDGNILTFKAVSDKCALRMQTQTGNTWELQ